MIYYLIGFNLLIFVPVWGDIKIFDFLVLLLFMTRSLKGFYYFRCDLFYILFVLLSLLSLAWAQYSLDSSILQTLRYFVFFVAARLIVDDRDVIAFLRGVGHIIIFSMIWVVFDVLFYYSIGDCSSINEVTFFWVDYMPAHRYPIPVGDCLYFRPSGLSWDPGGFYPLALFLAALYGRSSYYNLMGFFSIFAVSRTGVISYISGKLEFIRNIPPLLFISLTVFVIPSVVLFGYFSSIELFTSIEFTTGTIRHLTYPALAMEKVVYSPRYLLFGNGLRGCAAAFLDSEYAFLRYFIDGMAGQKMKNFVVESIWTNILLGAGLFALIFYLTWLSLGFRRNCRHLLFIIVVGGLFYTFDSSQFCFIVPFAMVISRKYMHRTNIS